MPHQPVRLPRRTATIPATSATGPDEIGRMTKPKMPVARPMIPQARSLGVARPPSGRGRRQTKPLVECHERNERIPRDRGHPGSNGPLRVQTDAAVTLTWRTGELPKCWTVGSPCGAGSLRQYGGMDCSGSRPLALDFGSVTKRPPRIELQSCCGGPASCSPSNHEDSHGTEHGDRVDERGGSAPAHVRRWLFLTGCR
jgi:hypothetical protein